MHQSLATNRTMESVDSMYSSMRSPNISSDTEGEFKSKQDGGGINISIGGIFDDQFCENWYMIIFSEMNTFAQSKLVTIVSEMEQFIQLYNEELVRELARKDEFEYEKEVRNRFITLLVAVQERRRKLLGGGKKQSGKSSILDNGATMPNNVSPGPESKLLDLTHL